MFVKHKSCYIYLTVSSSKIEKAAKEKAPKKYILNDTKTLKSENVYLVGKTNGITTSHQTKSQKAESLSNNQSQKKY